MITIILVDYLEIRDALACLMAAGVAAGLALQLLSRNDRFAFHFTACAGQPELLASGDSDHAAFLS
ncbi:MAG: hypothetical protein AAF610_00440 [Pseudomonadota bacterium]